MAHSLTPQGYREPLIPLESLSSGMGIPQNGVLWVTRAFLLPELAGLDLYLVDS